MTAGKGKREGDDEVKISFTFIILFCN